MSALRFSAAALALAVPLLLLNPGRDAHAGAEAFCSGAALITQTFINGTTWSFCWEIRAKEGLVIHHAFFRTSLAQGSVERRILWRAHIAEIFVPYDAGSPRYTDVFYGLGPGVITLNPMDCPPAVLPEERTLLFAVRPGMAMLEPLACKEVRDRGLAVKFQDMVTIRGEELLIWSSHQIGNYNYIMRWAFYDDGSFRSQIGLGGRQHILGAAHVHNVYWRLDFDLAGAANDLVETFAHMPSPPAAMDSFTAITVEGDETVDPATFRSWRTRDTAITNAKGNSISYELVPSFEGLFRGTAGESFAQADFWVTRYRACELYALINRATSANPSCPTDNVAEFISVPTAESVNGADVVIWYALHIHHLPRAEDELNMPVHWAEVLFRPRDFFDKNPLE